jgi:Chaperone for flagella basal body P-ring formation
MSNKLCTQLSYAGAVALLALLGTFVTGTMWATCYSTPRTAIDAVVTPSSFAPVSKGSGYRVAKIASDPVLEQRWAMITNCGHPEWPAFVLPMTGTGPLVTPQERERSLIDGVKATPLVRAGEVVRLWRQEDVLRIEVAGVSEENGGLGKTIRVHLLRRNTDDQAEPAQFFGIVRGPSDVEIQSR